MFLIYVLSAISIRSETFLSGTGCKTASSLHLITHYKGCDGYRDSLNRIMGKQDTAFHPAEINLICYLDKKPVAMQRVNPLTNSQTMSIVTTGLRVYVFLGSKDKKRGMPPVAQLV